MLEQFILLILFSIIMLSQLLCAPKIHKCPHCHIKLLGINRYCPSCKFDITAYLVETNQQYIPKQFQLRKKQYHQLAKKIVIGLSIGVSMFLPSLFFIIDSEFLAAIMKVFYLILVLSLMAAVTYYLLGIKCLVCGSINIYGGDQHCVHCGVPFQS